MEALAALLWWHVTEVQGCLRKGRHVYPRNSRPTSCSSSFGLRRNNLL